MINLHKQIRESHVALRKAWTELQKNPSTSIPSKSYETWVRHTGYHTILEGTLRIFEAREHAWETVVNVSEAEPTVSKASQISAKAAEFASIKHASEETNMLFSRSNMVKSGSIEMDFAVARHLALTSYVYCAWSIYDRLANVIGRISGFSSTSNDPKHNPKAIDHLVGKKELFGFATNMHLKNGYDWPIRASYKIRNWLIHEGFEENSIPMFKSEKIDDRFYLHDDAVKHIETCNEYSFAAGKIHSSCITEADESWPTKDLMKILPQYHEEIDTMFSRLLKWSCESLLNQISIFSKRD
jgi:hypothetical protein